MVKMEEPVEKKGEPKEDRTLIERANSGQREKMTEAAANEQETELVKPVFNSANPNQMAVAVAEGKAQEAHHEVKPSHEPVISDRMAEALASERLKLIDPEPEYISIKVKSQDGKLTFFLIRRDSKLKKLLISYCKKYTVYYPSARFLINGERFNHNKTAKELELEDGTEIDALVEFLGGGEQSFAWISAN